MARHMITAGCGHTTEMQLYGPMKERALTLAWIQSPSGKCYRCHAEAKQTDYQAEKERKIEEWVTKALAQYAEWTPTQRAEGIARLRVERPGRDVPADVAIATRRFLAAIDKEGEGA